MKRRFSVCLLMISCLFSTQIWALSSTVELGRFVVQSGDSLTINVDELSTLYADLTYKVICDMDAPPEDTTIGAYSTPSRLVRCGEIYHNGKDVCNVSAETFGKIVFKSISKGFKYKLSIRNFDQRNRLSFICRATPTED